MRTLSICFLAGTASAFSVGDPTSTQRVFVSTPASKYPKKLVRDYMTKPVHYTVTPSTLVDEAMELFIYHGITGAPVISDDDNHHLVGILSSFDFLHKEAFEGSLLPVEGTIENVELYVHAAQRICGQTVADVMTRDQELFTVKEDTPLREAAAIMTQHRLHRLPVVSKSDTRVLVGMLTAEHVLHDLLHLVRSLPPGKDDPISNEEGNENLIP
eukprot:CAMPEP_0198143888 /NCGR_PEP_ID=MMETSP1443-20131203/11370_1 /TAXON_ID=186043 /ORGANISM="Entomoneis sp., Strain CCMP2396" /LENGTH=213 /DNA_ID=CAMNT_0043807191 /DNA_START=51 /DNA_END=695 /DNA_ORIENTATION=-